MKADTSKNARAIICYNHLCGKLSFQLGAQLDDQD